MKDYSKLIGVNIYKAVILVHFVGMAQDSWVFEKFNGAVWNQKEPCPWKIYGGAFD